MSKKSGGRSEQPRERGNSKPAPVAGQVWVAVKGEHTGYKQIIVSANELTVRVTIGGKQARHTGGGKVLSVPMAQFLARHDPLTAR